MLCIADHLRELLREAGYTHFLLTTHSVWENYSAPPPGNLVLQLLPAYTEKEAGCPLINIRPLLKDKDDPDTIGKVMAQVQNDLIPLSRAG
jgi:hypothetical protein